MCDVRDHPRTTPDGAVLRIAWNHLIPVRRHDRLQDHRELGTRRELASSLSFTPPIRIFSLSEDPSSCTLGNQVTLLWFTRFD